MLPSISSRALIQGLYGITPNALEGECILRPGFPATWDSASVHTPYLDYSFKRVNGKEIFEIRQNFKQPLKIVIRQNMGEGKYLDTAFSTEKVQHIELPVVKPEKEEKKNVGMRIYVGGKHRRAICRCLGFYQGRG